MLYYFYWKKESPGGGDLSGGDAIPSTMLFLICLLAWAGLRCGGLGGFEGLGTWWRKHSMNGGDLVDRGVIWLYTVEGVLMFQSNKLYLKILV